MYRAEYRLDQSRAPFLEGLRQYSIDKIIPFHTPGHKQGRSLDPGLQSALGKLPFLLDVSDEIASQAHGNDSEKVLREAEALAADAFGAKTTFFSTTVQLQVFKRCCWQPVSGLVVGYLLKRFMEGRGGSSRAPQRTPLSPGRTDFGQPCAPIYLRYMGCRMEYSLTSPPPEARRAAAANSQSWRPISIHIPIVRNLRTFGR